MRYLDHDPLDYEHHQVMSLYGKASTARLAAMQEFCDQPNHMSFAGIRNWAVKRLDARNINSLTTTAEKPVL